MEGSVAWFLFPVVTARAINRWSGRKTDVPYDPQDKAAVLSFWHEAVAHRGVQELRATRGRPPKAEQDKKEHIALRVDADVLAWYRRLGAGWQTRMNAVLRAYRDASL